MVTHLQPDILECEVEWALGSITTNKARVGDGILAELFKIIKDDAVKVLHSMCQQIWKTQQWPKVFIPISKKGNAKECSNYCTIVLISHASTSWKIEEEKVETVTDFIFLGSKITVDSDCRQETNRRLLLGRKAMTNLDSVLKSRQLFADKGSYGQSYGFSNSQVQM